jgi:hypothetical protein
MSYRTILASAVTALGLAAATASAGLLANPGFEAFVSGSPDASSGDVPMNSGGPWAGWNNWVSPFSGYYTDDVAHTGTQAGKTFSGPNAGIYQNVSVTAGQQYTASAYFLNRSGVDALNGIQTVDIRITFFDGANGTGNNLGIFVAPTAISAGTPVDTWTPLSVTAIAPLGAQSAQVMAFFNNPEFGGGALYVDDMDLVAVPEPASLAALGVAGMLLRRRRS